MHHSQPVLSSSNLCTAPKDLPFNQKKGIMRGCGLTAAFCAGAASGFLGAYWLYHKRKASAGLSQPEAVRGTSVHEEEVASDRPSSALLQLRALPSPVSSVQQAEVQQVSTTASSYESHAEQQVADGTLQQLSRQESGSPRPNAALLAARQPIAWRGSWHPVFTHNPPAAETQQTVTVQGVKYLKLEWLGEGGSSEVTKVINPLNKVFAFKRVQLAGVNAAAASGFIEDANFLRRLRQEPDIVNLVGCQVLWPQGVLYMIQECGETDLQCVLEERNASRRAVSSAAQGELLKDISAADEDYFRMCWAQMLKAVAAIHKQGIVHRDLKPANFVLVDGQLKLIDFGVAKQIPKDREALTCLPTGTMAYMAPEAIPRGRNNSPYVDVGRYNDVWSLGCVFYEMTYGRTPFAHLRSKEAMLSAICNPGHQVDYPPVANAQLLEVVKRCLDWNPLSRATVQELLGHPFLRPKAANSASAGRLNGPYRPF